MRARRLAALTVAVAGAAGAAGAAGGSEEQGGAPAERLILFDGHERPRGFEFPVASGIYVVRADGSGLRRLARDVEAFPSWSPDGTRVAYAKQVARCAGCDPVSDLHVAGVDGSPPRRLTHTGSNVNPAWSPTGDVIAFDRCRSVVRGGCSIAFIGADGTGLRELPDRGASGPVWSPDGTRLALHALGRRGGISVMAADGSGRRRLTRGNDSWPVWSPDGRQIAFERLIQVRDRLVRTDVYAIGADGTGLRRLTRGGIQNIDPAWSPDGRLIAFVGWRRRSRGCPRAAIEVMAPDGSARRRITERRPMYGGPAWSPDGGRLTYVSIRRCWRSRYSLYVSDADGSGERRVPTGDAEPDVSWSWQPGLG